MILPPQPYWDFEKKKTIFSKACWNEIYFRTRAAHPHHELLFYKFPKIEHVAMGFIKNSYEEVNKKYLEKRIEGGLAGILEHLYNNVSSFSNLYNFNVSLELKKRLLHGLGYIDTDIALDTLNLHDDNKKALFATDMQIDNIVMDCIKFMKRNEQ